MTGDLYARVRGAVGDARKRLLPSPFYAEAPDAYGTPCIWRYRFDGDDRPRVVLSSRAVESQHRDEVWPLLVAAVCGGGRDE